MKEPRLSEQQQRILMTAAFVLIIAALLKLFTSDGPETRAHIPLQEIAIKCRWDAVLRLLNYTPDAGVYLYWSSRVDSLTTYILEHTNNGLPQRIARNRAKWLFLASVLVDVPIDMLVAQAHAEGHFWTQWLAKTTHNMLNIGNTDSGGTRTFASFQLGTFCAAVNIANRIYRYRKVFGREEIDYTAIWTNRDTITWKGFLPSQLNYNKENPFLEERNPAWAYMSDPNGSNKLYDKINKLTFLSDDDLQIELTDMQEEVFYYEKTVSFDDMQYFSFSYLTGKSPQKTIWVLRSEIATLLWISSTEIIVLPYDHSEERTHEEDKRFPSKQTVLYFIFKRQVTQ